MSRKLRGVTFMLSVFFAAVIPPHFIGCGCDKLLFFYLFLLAKNPPRKGSRGVFADFVGKVNHF